MATVTENRKAQLAFPLAESVRIYLQIENAYDECDEEIKASIEGMKAIVRDPEATEDERTRALSTIVEALYPGLAVDFLALCHRERQSPGAVAKALEMEREEEQFAEKVRTLMEERGMTQEELGNAIGVGQGAVSLMLKRQCRPQKKTVVRLAEALNVSPEELWPGIVQKS